MTSTRDRRKQRRIIHKLRKRWAEVQRGTLGMERYAYMRTALIQKEVARLVAEKVTPIVLAGISHDK